jgi:hypothetical protein
MLKTVRVAVNINYWWILYALNCVVAVSINYRWTPYA